MQLDLITLIVDEYDEAVEFFVHGLGFVLDVDEPAATNDGRPKRWVVVRPPRGGAGILLARADGPEQDAVIGRQFAGRVGMFLQVRDVDEALRKAVGAGAELVRSPRDEPYGRVGVFADPWGNKWDLVAPRSGLTPTRPAG